MHKTLLTFTAIAFLGGCQAVTFMASPGELADRLVNTVSGGEPGVTISGEAGFNRYKGSETAAMWCEPYKVVSWYDAGRFTREENQVFDACLGDDKPEPNDHCSRWYWHDYGILHAKVKELRAGKLNCEHDDRYTMEARGNVMRKRGE